MWESLHSRILQPRLWFLSVFSSKSLVPSPSHTLDSALPLSHPPCSVPHWAWLECPEGSCLMAVQYPRGTV